MVFINSAVVSWNLGRVIINFVLVYTFWKWIISPCTTLPYNSYIVLRVLRYCSIYHTSIALYCTDAIESRYLGCGHSSCCWHHLFDKSSRCSGLVRCMAFTGRIVSLTENVRVRIAPTSYSLKKNPQTFSGHFTDTQQLLDRNFWLLSYTATFIRFRSTLVRWL